MKENENIAILLFSRYAKRESHLKRWTNNPQINLQIAGHLISNTYEQLKTANFPIWKGIHSTHIQLDIVLSLKIKTYENN